jgi:hypothetical protein
VIELVFANITRGDLVTVLIVLAIIAVALVIVRGRL